MLESFLSPLLPVVFITVCFFIPAFITVFLIQRRNRHRRSPLTFKLLRSPGHTLLTKMESINDDISMHIFLLWIIPAAMFAMHISVSLFAHQPESWQRIGVDMLVCLTAEVYAVRKLLKLFTQKNRL